MPILKIRFNTEHNGSKLKWRAINFPEWNEQLVKNVQVEVPTWTTEDILPDGKVKHHITMEYNELSMHDGSLIVK